MTTESIPIATPLREFSGPPQGTWTYDDYLAIPDDGRRYEILAGVLTVAPSPNASHQLAVIKLTTALDTFLTGNDLGTLFIAPFDVRLGHDTVVQPDLLVVLAEHAGQIGEKAILGAPDLVIEVASPGTATYDRDDKRHSYERAGVPEYWIVDPAAKTVELFVLEDGNYVLVGAYQGESHVPSAILQGFGGPVRSFFG
jgi:Uma2 family endonuclease